MRLFAWGGGACRLVPLGLAGELALFQTKDHFREPSSFGLIQHSLEGLTAYALAHPQSRIALPYPGIGMGGLHPANVQPLLQLLPPNVTVWRLRYPQRKILLPLRRILPFTNRTVSPPHHERNILPP